LREPAGNFGSAHWALELVPLFLRNGQVSETSFEIFAASSWADRSALMETPAEPDFSATEDCGAKMQMWSKPQVMRLS
jgi:hypothetical protein